MKIFIFLCFHAHKNSQINHFNSIFKSGKFWGVTTSLNPLISGEPASLLLNLATPCYALTKLDRKLGPREKTISLGARLMHGTEFILIIII